MTKRSAYKVLVVDDDVSILELLKYNLEKENYEVRVISKGEKAVALAKEFLPDLILLDVMMPEMDGVEICRQLRAIPKLNNTYIVFLTARSEEYSEVAAFDIGADDYITKPIKPRALMSRLKAVFRRESKGRIGTPKIIFDDLIIDRYSYTVTLNNKEINLPKKEFELLHFIAQHPNKVYTRDELLLEVWGSDVYVSARTVDVHIRKLRGKIGDDFIATVKGVGYKFNHNL